MILPLLLLVFASLAWADEASPDRTFENQVLPILQASCLPCHDAATRTSGLAVMTRADLLAGGARHGAAIAPGHPERSVLLRVLQGESGPRMPLGGKPLGQEQIGVISEWIRHLKPQVGEAEAEKQV